MRRLWTLLLFLALSVLSASAQMVQDASYRIIGHTKGVPMEWAALYFFFPDIL